MGNKNYTRLRILGCGSSGGVPRIGGDDGQGDWGACDPTNQKNYRTRCSALVETSPHPDFPQDKTTHILIDTSPDLRTQLLAARINRLDAVFITHDHADQLHGLDDLRALVLRNRKVIPLYYHPITSPEIRERFRYCFERAEGSFYPAILSPNIIDTLHQPIQIEGAGGIVEIAAFTQQHGAVQSLGFRIGSGPFGFYSADVSDLSNESFAFIHECAFWVLDALRRTPHLSHTHLDKALQWLQQVGAMRGILTNLHLDMDYQTLSDELPPHIRPAYDGMVINLP